MRAKIRAKKVENGWVMVCILPDGTIETPQEGRTHSTRKSVYNDARHMYPPNPWDWRESDKSIKID